MIIFDQVHKQYGPHSVLRGAAFSVTPGERIGIVGPNGAGKTTLFRLITNEETPDKGEVIVAGNPRIGCLRQQLPGESAGALLDYAKSGCTELLALEEEVHRLQRAVGESTDPELLRRLGEAQHEFEHREGYQLTARAEAALGGLGFAVARFQDPVSSFSGGWQMRAQLARVLLAAPDILLLDEPSNYLDLPAVEWLQRFLARFAGTLLLISHDRHLLRSLASDILDLRRGEVTRFAGGYDSYVTQRKARIEQQEARWKTLHRQREDMETFIRRFRAQATKASLVQSRIKMLEKMEPLPELEREDTRALLRLPDPPPSGHELIRLEGVGHRYGDELPWLFQGVDLSLERGDRLALVGTNGMGKTTLLKILAARFAPAEGRRVPGHQLVVGYQSQEFAETLPAGKTAFEVVKSSAAGRVTDQQVRGLLGGFGFQGEACTKRVEVLSGGEKIRLAFARIFIHPPNLLLLDEPTTHLDLAGREALEQALTGYRGTVCLVSHDISFVRNTANGILSLGPEGVWRWPGGYDDFLSRGSATSGPERPVARAAKAAVAAVAVDEASAPEGKLRRERRKELRRMETRLTALEAEIERLEIRQAAELRALESGEVTDYKAHQLELARLAGDIQRVTREWVEVGEAADEIRAES